VTIVTILSLVFQRTQSPYLPEFKSTTGGLWGVLQVVCGLIQAENQEYNQAEHEVHHEAQTDQTVNRTFSPLIQILFLFNRNEVSSLMIRTQRNTTYNERILYKNEIMHETINILCHKQFKGLVELSH
jgi:hypothetical protein